MTKFEVYSRRYQELATELYDAVEYASAVESDFSVDKALAVAKQLINLKVPTNSKLKV